MISPRHRFAQIAAAVAATGAAMLLVALVAPAAEAIDGSYGVAGFCPDAHGVTVVVDFQQLGGETIVRCAPGSQPRTGLEVLRDAGLQIEGVQRWGDGFVCRIENRPSATEPLAVNGNDDYTEACIDTPPAAAFWSYWRADDGAEWQYSQEGVKNSQVEPGGFVGWSFSLDAAAGASQAPRIAPQRPPAASSPSAEPGGPSAEPPGPSAAATQGPLVEPPPLRHEPGGTDVGLSTGPAGRRGPTETEPTEPTGWTGGEALPDVDDQQPPGSAWSSMLGLVAVAAVAATAAAVSVRRRRSPPGHRQ